LVTVRCNAERGEGAQQEEGHGDVVEGVSRSADLCQVLRDRLARDNVLCGVVSSAASVAFAAEGGGGGGGGDHTAPFPSSFTCISSPDGDSIAVLFTPSLAPPSSLPLRALLDPSETTLVVFVGTAANSAAQSDSIASALFAHSLPLFVVLSIAVDGTALRRQASWERDEVERRGVRQLIECEVESVMEGEGREVWKKDEMELRWGGKKAQVRKATKEEEEEEWRGAERGGVLTVHVQRGNVLKREEMWVRQRSLTAFDRCPLPPLSTSISPPLLPFRITSTSEESIAQVWERCTASLQPLPLLCAFEGEEGERGGRKVGDGVQVCLFLHAGVTVGVGSADVVLDMREKRGGECETIVVPTSTWLSQQCARVDELEVVVLVMSDQCWTSICKAAELPSPSLPLIVVVHVMDMESWSVSASACVCVQPDADKVYASDLASVLFDVCGVGERGGEEGEKWECTACEVRDVTKEVNLAEIASQQWSKAVQVEKRGQVHRVMIRRKGGQSMFSPAELAPFSTRREEKAFAIHLH